MPFPLRRPATARARRRGASLRARLALLLATAGGVLPSAAWNAAPMHAAAQRIGPGAVAAVAPLQDLLASLPSLADGDRIERVNRWFNERVAFATDREVWGVEDRWTTPLELLDRGRGDCEDYAIAKYATLLAGGVAPARLRLVYVIAAIADRGGARPVSQPHLVLAYHRVDDPDPLILDNLRPEVLPATQRPDLRPVFSFDDQDLWQGEAPAGRSLARLSRWREVWLRTRDEGFLR